MASRFLAHLMDVSLRSLLLALAGALALWALRNRRSAAASHAIWTAVAYGMLLLFGLEPSLPSLPLHILRAAPAPVWSPVAIEPVSMPAISTPPEVVIDTASNAVIRPRPLVERPRSRPRSMDLSEIAVLLYASIALALFARLMLGSLLLRRLIAASKPVHLDDWPLMYESESIAVPVTGGWFKPKILLPAGWREWDRAKLDAVLAHESSHVRRRDSLAGFVAGLNNCLFWFHPLAWWLERELALLAEQACDQACVLALGNRAEYARVLLDMVGDVEGAQGWVYRGTLAMARPSYIRQRIELILDETRTASRGLGRTGWSALLLSAVPLVYGAATVRIERQKPPVPLSSPIQEAPAPPVLLAQQAPLPRAASSPAPVSPPAPAQPQDQASTIDVSGKVVDANTGAPLIGVRVELSRYPVVTDFKTADLTPRRYAAISDDHGDFTMRDLAPDRYSTNATLDGYGLARGADRSVTLSAGRSNPPVTLKMWKAATVEGIVEDQNHGPIANAGVDLLQAGWEFGMRTASTMSPLVRTDEKGRFSIPAVLPGAYYLRGTAVQAPKAEDLKAGRTRSETPPRFLDTFYPNSTELDGGAPITVYPGVNQAGLRLTLREGVYYIVSGRVEGIPEGVDRPGVRLTPLVSADSSQQLFSGIPSFMIRSPFLTDDTFSIVDVSPGNYRAELVSVSGNLRGSARLIVKDRNVTGLRLAVTPSWPFSGKVVYEDGTPAGPFMPAAVGLDSTNGTAYSFFTVSNKGEFSTPGKVAGSYRLLFADNPELVIAKVDLGDRSFEGAAFDIQAPGSDRVVITLSKQGAIVDGALKNVDGPVKGEASIIIAPAAKTDSMTLRWVPLDPSGAFTFKGLGPGQYRVCAWSEEGNKPAEVLANPAYQQRLDSDCATVRVKAGGHENVQVKQLSVADYR